MTGARPWDATQTEREITGANPATRQAALIGRAAANQIESVETACSRFDVDQVADESRNPRALRPAGKTNLIER